MTKSGRVLYCAWHNTVTRDRTGMLESVLSLVLDETAECEAEAAAERAAEQLERAQRAAMAGIWDAEISSGEVTWSAPYRELYGLPPDAVASFESWVETIQKMVDSGVTHIVECGPGKVLAGMTKRIAPGVKSFAAADRASLEEALKC